MKRIIKKTCLLILSGTALVAEAKLEFESLAFEGTADFSQPTVPFEFSFENIGDYAVEITEIDTSCGCTTSELDKMIYQPGESGVIRGELKVGSRQGTIRQHVHVHTDDPEQAELKLDVKVTVPQLIEITPKLVNWRLNEAPELKSIKLSPDPSRGVEVTDVSIDSDDFVVELVESQENEDSFEVIVGPVVTDSSIRGLIRISTTYGDGETRDFFVHAMVR